MSEFSQFDGAMMEYFSLVEHIKRYKPKMGNKMEELIYIVFSTYRKLSTHCYNKIMETIKIKNRVLTKNQEVMQKLEENIQKLTDLSRKDKMMIIAKNSDLEYHQLEIKCLSDQLQYSKESLRNS